MNHLIATEHLTVECSTISTVVTPVTPIGQKDNSRWYCNRLTNDARQLDFNAVKQDIGNRIDALRKKIKQALVKPNISTAEQRRVAFHRMVKMDDEVDETLNVVADTAASIEYTVTMVLNSCL